jgi:uncharacterized protein YdaU (DUF1376 family)
MKVRHIPLYATEWLEGTIELSNDERGVYFDIIALIYARGGPITTELIKARSGLHGNAFNRILDRLKSMGKIERNGEEIDQKRCRNELEKVRKTIGNAPENGAKVRKIKWLERQNDEATLNLKPITNNQEERTEKKETRRGSRLPADFTVPEEWIKEGKEVRIKAGLPSVNLSAEAEHFVDYWVSRAGRDGAKLDWRATWRNWCRNVRTTHANGNLNGSSEVSERPTPKGPPPKVEGWEIPVHGRTH